MSAAATAPLHYTIDIQGRQVHLVDDQTLWRLLTADGAVVFSQNEMARVKACQQACIAGGREDLSPHVADTVLHVKEIFGGSYIRSGGRARLDADFFEDTNAAG